MRYAIKLNRRFSTWLPNFFYIPKKKEKRKRKKEKKIGGQVLNHFLVLIVYLILYKEQYHKIPVGKCNEQVSSS